MANLRVDNISGTGGRNAMKGSVFFSGYVDGSSADWLQIHDNLADFNVGTGDFTFECWLKGAKSSGGYAGIFGMYNYDTAGILIQIHDNGRVRLTNPGAIDITGSDTNAIVWGPNNGMGDWHHYAVARSGSTLKAFLNGVEQISTSYSNAIDFSNGGSAVIGITDRADYPGDYDFQGYISNLRLIKGTALYTSAFTPPTEELTAVENTVLLCCQDSDDPTQEATGRHEIVGFRRCYQGKRYSNIATNGDLEDGTTTGWTNNGCGTFEISNNSHSGTYSLHCVSDGNGDSVYNTLTLNTTLRYKISAYINCVGPLGTSAKAKMKIGTSLGGSQNYESQTANVGAGWQYVEWIGIPSSATTYVSFNESSANNVNDWYIDDLKVELWYPEEDQNILANPNFLTGATGWTFTNGTTSPAGSTEWTIGSDKLTVTDTGRSDDAIAEQKLFSPANADGRYRYQVHYSMSVGDFDIGVGGNRDFGLRQTYLGGAGNNASLTYEVQSGSSDNSFEIVTNQHGAGYFTNVQLFRIAEPKRINPTPPYGVDAGVTFEGETKHNTQSYMYFPTGDTSQRGRGRGLFCGGYSTPNYKTRIDYVQIQTTGNAQEFGDLSSTSTGEGSACASSTRAVQGGGSLVKTMEYVTIANTSNVTTFGELTVARRSLTALSNNTRGCWGGGTTNPAMSQVIDYVTIATKGDAVTFGDLIEGRRNPAVGSITSTTRGVFAGGNPGSSPNLTNRIDYITIASTGDATDFGDQVTAMREQAGASSSVRGIVAGGYTSPANLNRIEYITIATTGNASDFGDLNIAISGPAGTSNSTRALFAGGSNPYINAMEYVTIASTGNAADFGDITLARMFYGGTSDSHGGLS